MVNNLKTIHTLKNYTHTKKKGYRKTIHTYTQHYTHIHTYTHYLYSLSPPRSPFELYLNYQIVRIKWKEKE